MAKITPDLELATDLSYQDRTLLNQRNKDTYVHINLIETLAWAERWDKEYIGEYEIDVPFTKYSQFLFYQGLTFFVKADVTLPYSTTTASPLSDPNLTTEVVLDEGENHEHSDFVEKVYPIGSCFLTVDGSDYSDFLKVKWELVSDESTSNVALGISGGSISAGDFSGANEVSLPVKEHTHNINIILGAIQGTSNTTTNPTNITSTTSPIGDHQHAGGYAEDSNVTQTNGTRYGSPTGGSSDGIARETRWWYFPYTSIAGEHTHTFTTKSHTHTYHAPPHTHSITTTLLADTATVDNAILQLEHKHVKVNVWKRIA